MKYTSTRSRSEQVSAAQAIIRGLAPDGGLYLPEEIPVFTPEELALLPVLSYRQTAYLVLGKYLDFSPAEIRRAVTEAYQGFDTPEAVALVPVKDGLYSLELWHGPTCAFKDMALQLLPRLLTLSLRSEGIQQITHILTATSGDTGKAALEGFRDVPGTRITVFYPEEGVSPIQKAQMVRAEGDNVDVVAVKGNFDDAQNAVKAIFSDRALAERLAARGIALSSANSINWGRLLPQIVYYVYAAAHLGVIPGEEDDEDSEPRFRPVRFSVPTGNFGDILAGYLAKRMGAPVGRLICASNQNRVLTDFFETGVYDRNRPFYKTGSPSMDILISSNLERLLCLASDGDRELVASLMQELRDKGSYRVPDALLARLKADFSAQSADDAKCTAVIAKLASEAKYTLDPHSAVGFFALEAEGPAPEGPSVLVSTASPFKFSATVLGALGRGVPADDFAALDALAEATGLSVPERLARLRELPERFTQSCEKEKLAATVE